MTMQIHHGKHHGAYVSNLGDYRSTRTVENPEGLVNSKQRSGDILLQSNNGGTF
jgi:superoxide dismutase